MFRFRKIFGYLIEILNLVVLFLVMLPACLYLFNFDSESSKGWVYIFMFLNQALSLISIFSIVSLNKDKFLFSLSQNILFCLCFVLFVSIPVLFCVLLWFLILILFGLLLIVIAFLLIDRYRSYIVVANWLVLLIYLVYSVVIVLSFL